jgi:hypothetical protein
VALQVLSLYGHEDLHWLRVNRRRNSRNMYITEVGSGAIEGVPSIRDRLR